MKVLQKIFLKEEKSFVMRTSATTLVRKHKREGWAVGNRPERKRQERHKKDVLWRSKEKKNLKQDQEEASKKEMFYRESLMDSKKVYVWDWWLKKEETYW